MRKKKWKQIVTLLTCLMLTLEAPPVAASSGTNLEEKSAVPYTQEEQSLLELGRKLYQESVDLWNGQETYYEETPVYKTLPITAGKIHEDKIKASVLLINAIRASAGIGQLEYSPEITQAAQDKAVLVAYANSNGLGGGHYLTQYEGITDEMYQSGMSYMNENLYMCGILGGVVLGSINQALNDGYGDPWTCGHRYNLLDPDYARVGLGEVGGQGVHKFSGSQGSDVDMVAWPSKGIAALESINSKNLNWTIKFYKDYHINKNTTVQAKLLNNGQTWEFSLEEIPECTLQDSVRYRVYTGSNQLAFYNSQMPLEKGNVFEITVNNLTNDEGDSCSYQYRTVCENFSQSEENRAPGQVTGLRAAKQTTKEIQLSWKADSLADSYRVYRYNSKKKRWTRIGTVNGTSYTDKKRKAGEKYQYRVEAVNESGTGEASAVLKTAAKPAKPVLKLQKKGNGKVKLSWKKVNADKIEIFYKIGKKKYRKLKLVSAKKTSLLTGKLKKGKTYYFRVRAYTKNGKKVYGSYSKARKIVIS